MRVIGKCPPEPAEFADAADRGFDAVELYLTTAHLDAFEETLAACRQAAVDVESVHTPHVGLDQLEYYKRAEELAWRVGAEVICVHSALIDFQEARAVRDEVGFRVTPGFENDYGADLETIEAVALDGGLHVTLDTAHLYVGVPPGRYKQAVETLLLDHGDAVPLVHLTDGREGADNLPHGEGELDLAWTGRLLKEHYDGTVVLEVMPAHQQAAREAFERY